jgi:hypothetical protein
MDYTWTCGCCGKQFNTLPLDFSCKAPDQWSALPENERAERGTLDSDLCKIDEDLFVSGCLEVPIIGREEVFIWGVWASVSRQSLERILELWDAPVIADEPPKFGWLCNNLPLYPTTLGLKTNLHLRSGGVRPAIELEPTDHPLAIEQRAGISLQRVEEIVAALSLRH